MRRVGLLNSLIIILLFVALVCSPPLLVNSKSLQQNSNLVQATGQICPLDGGDCGSFIFTFTLTGGPVNGTYHVTYPAIASDGTNIGTYDEKGILKGNFTGGDGGSITGTFHAHANLTSGGSPHDYDGTWKGTINSDGTTSGTISAKGLTNSWSATFSPVDFQSGSNSTTSSENPTATQEPTLLPTPTSFEVVGMKIDIYPKAKEFIASSPSIDEAIKKIFNQDSLLIVRDANNNYYAVTNQKKTIPLPAELSNTFQLSNQFAILGNDGIISKSGHGSISGDINGGNNSNQQERTPADFKDKDYMSLETNCSVNPKQSDDLETNRPRLGKLLSPSVQFDGPVPECRSSVVQNELGSSFRVGGKSLYGEETFVGSSEHSSVRGTINGGGDFIYDPNPIILASFKLPLKLDTQQSTFPAYLGVLVQDRSNGAEVILVQANSPAETTGIMTGDIITNVSGTIINNQQPLYNIINKHHGGDEIELAINRNDQSLTINLILAKLLPPIIKTPSAEIIITDKTNLIVDIGFNGVTGILVLEDSAHVREPVTGSEVDVPAGQALIIVPGEPVGEPFDVSDTDINSWWKNSSSTSVTSTGASNPSESSDSTQNTKGYKDFNPIPGTNAETLYWVFCIVLGILYLIILLIKIFKK